MKIIESYLLNYEHWLEPVCFILLLEICADAFIEKYLLMLKEIFSAGLYKLPVDKDHLLGQVSFHFSLLAPNLFLILAD